MECRTDGAALPVGNRSGYVGTAKIEDIDTAEVIHLIGVNPRVEAPVLNARLRKAWLRGAKVTLTGEAVDLTFPYAYLGTGAKALTEMVNSAEPAEGALVILGHAALTGENGGAVLGAAMGLAERLGGKFLVLHHAASRVGAMDLGFTTEGGLGAALDGRRSSSTLAPTRSTWPPDPSSSIRAAMATGARIGRM